MSLSGMRGRETRQSVPLGRVELLFDNGEVEQTWDIGLGSWAIGSSSQCGISIAGDSSIAARHLELTVGRRYTLLKASHSIGVAGRVVREWLIDRTTVVECGSRKLKIYPVGFSASELAQLSVVTQERIPEVASKLATAARVKSATTVLQSPTPVDSATEMGSDLKRQLDEMRLALEAMQSRVSAVPDPDVLEHRIKSLTSRSMSAIEENLSQQLRQPLREEIADLIQQERRRWESELQQRLDSIEVQIRETSSQVDESLRAANRDIGNINQRVQDFVRERGSANPVDYEKRSCEDQLSSMSERNRSVYSSGSELRREDDASMQRAKAVDGSDADHLYSDDENDHVSMAFDSDSKERSLSPCDSLHSDVDERHQESSQAIASDSDEILEFQVDDESISLRLNRMLGEMVDRRGAVEESKAGGGVSLEEDSAQVSERADSAASDADASAALSGRYLLELNHMQDSAGNERPNSTAWKGETDAGLENSFKKETCSGDSEPSGHSSDEASIEEYMQRLLARVRSGPSGNAPTASPTELPKNSVSTSRTGQRNATTGGSASSSIRSSSRVSGGGRTVAKPVPEVKSDLQALRELANSNARRAINRSASQRSGARGLAKSMIVGIALLIGIALLVMDIGDAKIKLGGIAISTIIAIVWGVDTCRDLYSMMRNKVKEADDEPLEEAKVAKIAANKSRSVKETK